MMLKQAKQRLSVTGVKYFALKNSDCCNDCSCALEGVLSAVSNPS